MQNRTISHREMTSIGRRAASFVALVAALTACTPRAMTADVKLAPILSDNMVLQMLGGCDNVYKSATAYFFARELQKKINVPIGLISTSWGGTPAEAWTGIAELQNNKDLAFYLDDPNQNEWFPTRPAVLYNTMIHPLIKFAIKGVIWYQGESNRNDARLYDKLMTVLIECWRSDWGRGAFPFDFVQMAPYNIKRIRSNYLQNTASWIFLPKAVHYALSRDGRTFTDTALVTNTVPDSATGVFTKQFSAEVQTTPARYVKVIARGIGTCPAWHPGKGKGDWLFVDEIVVE